MLLIGTQDSEEDASVGEKTIPEREHQKSYVAVAFENAYKNDELWDSTAPGMCKRCLKILPARLYLKMPKE